MKQFPINQAVIILLLCTAILCLLQFISASQKQTIAQQPTDIAAPEHFMQTTAIFRFSEPPKSIKLTDSENNLLYHTDAPEFSSEHESPEFNIPLNQTGDSQVRLLVEWNQSPDNYHFFTVEVDKAPMERFGLHSVTETLAEEITIYWK